MKIPGVTIIGPLAYRGKAGCQNTRCTRRDVRAFLDGTETSCFGWHCSYCDEPCSSQGHHCPAGDAILAESERALREEGSIP